MAVNTRRKEYDKALPRWTMLRDNFAGQEEIKLKGAEYLPMPSGFAAQSDGGMAAYDAYKKRAQFPDWTPPTARGASGVIHRVEAKIEMPERMEYLRERCTSDGRPLSALHEELTNQVLQVGRVGLFADAPRDGGDPLLSLYEAESIINWSDAGDFYVLEEIREERGDDGFTWNPKTGYRVLDIENGTYRVRVYEAADVTPEEVSPRAAAGRGGLVEIPFVVIGSTRLGPAVDEIPLYGVSQASFAAYRLDADYRFQMYMSGQETLFCFGVEKGSAPTHVGAGVVWSFDNPAASAVYVGPAGVGIGAHRTALQDERMNAAAAGARLFDDQKLAAESGEALKIRYGAQTATLTSIAKTVCAGMERVLRQIAVFLGLDPETVVVTPNLSFLSVKMAPGEAVQLVSAWQAGGISYQTLYENLQRGEIASAERTWEEEREQIEDEMPEPTDEPPLPGEDGEGEDEEDDGEDGATNDLRASRREQ